MYGWPRRVSGLVGVLLTACIILQPIAAYGLPPAIYQLQTGGAVAVGTATAATQEYISVYNNYDQPVDVTSWCVSYASASDITKTQLGCLVPPDIHTRIILGAYSSFSLATNQFVAANTGFVPDIIFNSGVSGESGHIRLLDNMGLEVDRLGYGSAANPESFGIAAHAAGKILQRNFTAGSIILLQDTDNNSIDFAQATLTILPSSGLYEEVVTVDLCTNISGLQTSMPVGYLLDENNECQQDLCANLDGLQQTVPEGYESIDGENCTLLPLENAPLIITELLANAPSFDAGQEFIEIFNPNDRPIELDGYKLQLGPTFNKSFNFPGPNIILPGAYLSFGDILTGLILPNSSASLRLLSPAGNVVSTTGTYEQPAEDQSWAMIGDVWQYTNQPTPGQPNVASIDDPEDSEPETGLAPCGSGKERNPETNRCRSIQVAVSGLAACKAGQERNPETNRCRSILSGDGLVPCKPGQERNPETNRCRSVNSAESELKPCAEGQERNPETNRCRKINSSNSEVAGLATVKDVSSGNITTNPAWLFAGLGVAGAVGYAGYEWRREVFGFLSNIKNKLIK